jgi:simple sugar transport system permease protein
MAFSNIVGAWLMVDKPLGAGLQLNPFLVIIIVLLIGFVIGFINGYIVVKVGMNPLISTFSMMLILRGLTLLWTKGETIFGLPDQFTYWGSGLIEGFPVIIIILLVSYSIAHIVLKHREFGRNAFSVGGNLSLAIESGIRVDRVMISAYILSGILSSLAGILLAGQLNSVPASMGEGMIFYVIAAPVIGGVSLYGGVGNCVGILGGVLLLGLINNGLSMMQVSVFWEKALSGIIILSAVLVDNLKHNVITKAEIRLMRLRR